MRHSVRLAFLGVAGVLFACGSSQPAGGGGATPATGGTGSPTGGTTSMAGSPGSPAGTSADPGMVGTPSAPTGTGGMTGGSMDPMVAGSGMEPMDPMVTDPMTGTPHEDLGEGDLQDVITMGDSYMNLILSGTEISLERISGRDYRNYSVAGTRMLDGAIPGQYDRAKAADPDIKTVVMTGGGNDIIQDSTVLSNCQAFNDACKAQIDKISDAVIALMTKMAADGVQDVVYLGYAYPTQWDLSKSADYSREKIAATCLSSGEGPAGLRCHFVDPVKEASPPIPIGFDGIHPTPAGYDTLGQLVWDRMQAEGVRR